VETLSAVDILSGELASDLPHGAAVVAPDLGAVKLAERYAAVLRGQAAHWTSLATWEVARW
jgi:ribose-phosphate pyrophosphokinase